MYVTVKCVFKCYPPLLASTFIDFPHTVKPNPVVPIKKE